MIKIVVSVILLLIMSELYAQPEQYTKAVGKFQTDFNAGKYTDIFNCFSKEMQQQLSLQTTRKFFADIRKRDGKLETIELVDFPDEAYAVYKTGFEKSVKLLTIALNDRYEISGLMLKPFDATANTSQKTINGLGGYPEAVAGAIYANAANFPSHTQLAIAVIANGEVAYYGVLNANDTLQPVRNQDRVFEIGSVTKVFTSSVLASLVADNKLRLTDDINRYYDFKFKGNRTFRFLDLANNTSGLPRLPANLDLSDTANPYKNYGQQEIEIYLKRYLKPESKPGVVYNYSNLGVGLLGYTLGLSQQTTFQDLLQKRIFDKYGMKHSYTSQYQAGEKLVKGQDPAGKEVSNWDFDALFGGGGILSTAEDMVLFAQAQFDTANKDLALTRNVTFDINEHMKIGLGWHMLTLPSGQEVLWHNGGTGGYSSSMAVNMDNHTAVIVLSNLSAFSSENGKVDKLCFELMGAVAAGGH